MKLAPLGFWAAAAHAGAVFAMSAGAVSFGQIVKAAEPAFAVIVGYTIYGKLESKAKVAMLVPIIGGIMIASALMGRPKLLIADEPTTALDVTIQAQILQLLGELQADLGLSILLITHDLGVVAAIADDVAVMYAGRIVEQGPTAEVLDDPAHPYTRRLIDCVPELGGGRRELAAIPGLPPAVDDLPPGCAFALRCDKARDDCTAAPVELAGNKRRKVRCLYPETQVKESTA